MFRILHLILKKLPSFFITMQAHGEPALMKNGYGQAAHPVGDMLDFKAI